MSIPISQILALVGKLDDSAGENTARDRFRQFLGDNVLEIGQMRDCIGECLRVSGDQFNRALQDLVNHLGHFLGFEVAFGRYQGVQGQIGFDGHWQSLAEDFHIVVEVKTSDVYAIRPATLMHYVDDLISAKKIPSWDNALGLYVIGRPNPDVRQLENSIIAEKRTNQLRIISVDSLLSLAEMMSSYDVSHEDILAVIRPSTPTIDPVIDLMARLVAEKEAVTTDEDRSVPEPPTAGEAAYWLTPVKSTKEETAEECIQKLIGKERIYAFGERTPGRKHIKPGDWMGFYAVGKGIVAHATIATSPERKPHPKVRQSEKYPWVFRLDNPALYLNEPTVIDAELRAHLDAFQGRDPNGPWAWFVQATRKVTERDFHILTRQQT